MIDAEELQRALCSDEHTPLSVLLNPDTMPNCRALGQLLLSTDTMLEDVKRAAAESPVALAHFLNDLEQSVDAGALRALKGRIDLLTASLEGMLRDRNI